jgi:hypothetical protein
VSPSPHLKTETISSFQKFLFSSCLEFRKKNKVYKHSDCVIHHRQNPFRFYLKMLYWLYKSERADEWVHKGSFFYRLSVTSRERQVYECHHLARERWDMNETLIPISTGCVLQNSYYSLITLSSSYIQLIFNEEMALCIPVVSVPASCSRGAGFEFLWQINSS